MDGNTTMVLLHFSSQLCTYIGSLKSVMMGIFTPWRKGNTKIISLFLFFSLFPGVHFVKFYQHMTAHRPVHMRLFCY